MEGATLDESWAERPAFLLFGDQSLDSHGFFAQFYRQPKHGELARVFLQQANHALLGVVEKLPVLERATLPNFRTLRQLNEQYHNTELKHSGIDAALLTISQIAHYLDHAEKNCGDITQPHKTFLVGLCSGLWAASAISVAPSLPDLVHIGVQAVLLAFKTGSYVHAIGERLFPAFERSESWSYIFSVSSVEDVTQKLDAFHDASNLPPASRAYISAVSDNGIVVSGPPSTLDAIVNNKILPPDPIAIPVHGPYHAPHLHSTADIERILELDNPETKEAFYKTSPRSPIMDCSAGTWFPPMDTKSLLTSVASTILNKGLMFKKVLNGCVEAARLFKDDKCLVIPLGPTQNPSTLKRRLQQETGLEVTLRMPPPISAEATASKIGNHGSSGKPKLAIVGMAGRFPDAASHEALWKLLESGLAVHREAPPDRFNVKTHVDPSGKGKNMSHTPYGCWIKDPGLFDHRVFNMSPREARNTDPMQRLALTTAYEALEMSGYVPNRTPSTRLDRIGTFYGQTSDDWREINAAQDVDTYFITGGVRAFGPGRINYHFGFSGPSLNIDTACSSSAAAMQVACSALWARDCDTAIVGGLSCMTNPDIFAGLSKGQFLSKKGPCATFDNGADGYCRGDGCASVVVKRLDDALADQDRVLAVILGTATNHSADAISITHPHGPTQSILSTAILDEAGVDPHDVDYVEMHGTGTQAGDGTEMKSVTDIFAPANRPRPEDRPLFLGAVKANVGHGEAASGVTALIKVLMMLEKNTIPPHVGIQNGGEINKTFPKDFVARNVNIAFRPVPFRRRDGRPRRVFVNNFSAAGGNTGLLVEDPPTIPRAKPDPRTHHVITLSGRVWESVKGNAERLLEWTERNRDTPLSHISYSTTARKLHHVCRMSVTGREIGDLQAALRERIRDLDLNQAIPVPHQPKVVMMFTGQGSQYAAMGKEFYDHYSVFRESIDGFIDLARLQGFPSFLPLIDGTDQNLSEMSPVVLQLGLACFEMAAARLWASWGIKPAAVVGHSLGEYAALEVAGVLSASDVIYLVGSRAKLLVEKCQSGSHGMVAVQAPVETVLELMGTEAGGLNIACINSLRETVISGESEKSKEMATYMNDQGYKSNHLRVPFAFHSPQVEVILDDFEKLAQGVTYKTPKIPIISTVHGKVIQGKAIDAGYLRKHARDTVYFLDGLIEAQKSSTIDDKTVWLEMGPHPVLSAMVKATFGASTVAVPTLRRTEPCYKTLTSTLATLHNAHLKIDFNEYHRDFADSVRLLNLPTYAFNDKNYWIQYTGDWCLAKHNLSVAAAEQKPVTPWVPTTTVHKLNREIVEGGVAIVETESELYQEQLRNVVCGHQVNGAPLCPSSLYGDMAMTVCDYAYKLLRPQSKGIGCNVADMQVFKPLIFDDKAKSHILRLTVTANAEAGEADLVFHTAQGGKKVEHAHCKVYYGNHDEWQDEFDRAAYLIKSRVDFLMEAEKRGAASKIGRGLAYKLFSALVDYGARYRGMEEVILDSTTCEATAKIRFQTTAQDGTFYFSPYHIDSACHISGFIINGTDAVDSRERVFISHGWGSMRFTEIPDADKEYRSYIRMQPVKGTEMMAGDAYVFDGDKIIGMTGRIKFQAIKRHTLNMMLPPRGAKAISGPAPSAIKAVPSKKKKNETVNPSNIDRVNQRLKTVTSSVMDILVREIGCSHGELVDDASFDNLGADSLMALQVSSKIREELELDIEAQAWLDYPTVGAFKTYLANFETPGRKERAPSTGSARTTDDESREVESDSDVTTPTEASVTNSVKGDAQDDAEPGDSAQNQELRTIIRESIATEAGVDVQEVISASDWTSLGVDSLLGLGISSRIRELAGIEVPNDLFLEHPTLKDVERVLGVTDAPKKPATRQRKSTKEKPKALPAAASAKEHPRISLEEPAPLKPPRPTHIVDKYPHRTSSSVLLSGTSRDQAKQLFMIPDGSGSATSYTEIAKVGGGWCVWGLFSPFMRTPEEYQCGVYGMATKFIDQMKYRQPHGPYSLAGWSAGGVIAFEIVYQLVQAGEEVANLIIIDAPCPHTIEPLPQGLHAWFASIGLLGEGNDKKIPEWLLPHFAASITALSEYDARPIPKDKCPKVMAIWCEDGVCHLPTDPRPEPYPKGHALFLLENRTDFGPNRWEECLDVDRMQFRHMPGNHFSMIHGDQAKILEGFLREALLD
ncbi:polyketide synthase [Chaetomium tenue]|uniref:Polyketide synthase n=1 Tax=Chaetomium tenue TaxID=1854479 RepID=A0ACB7PKU6_9PEZI|nr:polyketide synthase [Chaetomium globosum]